MADVLVERREAFENTGRDSGVRAIVVTGALAEIKRSVRASLGYTLEQALEREIEAQERCWSSKDAREGFAAFLAKREPRYEGR